MTLIPNYLKMAPRVIASVWRHPANQGRRLRQVAVALTFQIRGRVARRPSPVPLGRKSRVLAYLDDSSSRKAAYANPPDWPEMHIWMNYLGPGSLFVDVGADIGLYTVLAIDAGAEAIAVEPRIEATERLRENLALNGYSATIAAVALSSRAGQAKLAGEDATKHHLVADDPVDNPARIVPVTTLDELLGKRHAHGVKIDVEGAERLVLIGAALALAEGRIGLLQLEWNFQSQIVFGEGREPVEKLLRAYGYQLFRPDQSGQLNAVSAPAPGRDVFAMRVMGRPAELSYEMPTPE